MFPFPRRSRALPILALAVVAPLAAQQPAAPPPPANVNLGTVKPFASVQPTVIAVPAFGRDGAAPVDLETMPRVIRRDLELSGFFKMPPDQAVVNSQNLRETRKNSIEFPAWRSLGVQHLLMANISVPSPGVLRAYVLLYDTQSEEAIIRRNIDGSVDDPRMLAHRISDEVVRFTKNCEGVAQTKLVYLTEQVPGIKEVAIMDADGFNQRPITRLGNICTTPSWGANGTEVYYTSYAGNRANIYGHRLSDNSTWKIAAYGGTNHSPDWCQATGRVVMTLSRDGNSELYTAGRDGSGLKRITTTKATEGSPCWAPDGSRIAYVSNEGGSFGIWISGADGGGARRLLGKGGWIDSPTWSPDGQRIAFVYREGGVNDVYTIAASGDPSTVRRLTMGQGQNESPCWAPNSRHLTFSSNRTGQWHVYMMLDDGSNQRPLSTSGRNTEPDWGPAPAQQ